MNLTLQRGTFDGLYSYEIVLLLMGIALFVVAIWAVVRAIQTGKSLLGTLPLLFFVVLFVGYPSVQAVQLSAAADEVSKLAATANDPAPLSPEAKQHAASQIALVAKRLGTTNNLAVVANAYQAIGDTDAALDTAKKVDAAKPPSAVSQALTPIYESRLKQAVNAPAADPSGVSAGQATQIRDLAQRVETSGVVTTSDTDVALARAYATLGDTAKASQRVDLAKSKKPDLKLDPKLEAQIKTNDASKM